MPANIQNLSGERHRNVQFAPNPARCRQICGCQSRSRFLGVRNPHHPDHLRQPHIHQQSSAIRKGCATIHAPVASPDARLHQTQAHTLFRTISSALADPLTDQCLSKSHAFWNQAHCSNMFTQASVQNCRLCWRTWCFCPQPRCPRR
jgi:hypothetical protein